MAMKAGSGQSGVEAYGMINWEFRWSWSVFSPVDVPHWAQTYSYLLPVGRTSNKRSLAGVAI